MHYITHYITVPGWGIGVSLIFARMRNTTLSHVWKRKTWQMLSADHHKSQTCAWLASLLCLCSRRIGEKCEIWGGWKTVTFLPVSGWLLFCFLLSRFLEKAYNSKFSLLSFITYTLSWRAYHVSWRVRCAKRVISHLFTGTFCPRHFMQKGKPVVYSAPEMLHRGFDLGSW